MRLTGKVVFKDIETGVWVLESDAGKTYLLAGGDRHIKKDGARIEADGEVDEDAVSFAMVGPVFKVSRYRFM